MKDIKRNDFTQDIVALIRKGELTELLKHYHERDVAMAVVELTDSERERLFTQFDAETLAELFPYFDDAPQYLTELPAALAAQVISAMDAADATDIVRELTPETKKALAAHLDDDTRNDVRRLLAFDEDEIGSRMSSNFVCIPDTLNIRSAMSELVRQAGDHDNIQTLYVVDAHGVFAGAIDLPDLIIASENDPLSGIIHRGYP